MRGRVVLHRRVAQRRQRQQQPVRCGRRVRGGLQRAPRRLVPQLLAYSAELASALAPGDYTATVSQADAAGNVGASQERAFTVEPAQTSESTASPDSAQAVRGKVVAGDAGSLESDDGEVFSVKQKRRVEWEAEFDGLPDDLTSLGVRYHGSSTRECKQTISIYDWRLAAYVAIDQRDLGDDEQEISLEDINLAGEPRDYVSGEGGNGTVRLRFKCKAATTLSTDLLEIAYEHP